MISNMLENPNMNEKIDRTTKSQNYNNQDNWQSGQKYNNSSNNNFFQKEDLSQQLSNNLAPKIDTPQ